MAPRPPALVLSPNLIYHQGIIAAKSGVLDNLFARTSFDGIVHLAGISLDEWCGPRENECHEVNVGGTELVLEQITRPLRGGWKRGLLDFWSADKAPWLIYGSSVDVYGDGENGLHGVYEEIVRQPVTALGRSKFAAEEAVERAARAFVTEDDDKIRKRFDSWLGNDKPAFRALILRFSEVYGYNSTSTIPESFVPALLKSALTAMPIQYNSDIPPHDLMHIGDAVEAVLKSVHRIDAQAQVGTDTHIDFFNVVAGGRRWYQEELVEIIRIETESLSPLMDIGDHKTGLSVASYSNHKLTSAFGWEPSITVGVGLTKAYTDMSDDIAQYSRLYRAEHCAPTAEFPSVDGTFQTFIEDQRNQDLQKLAGCTATMAFNHNGWLHHIKCQDGLHCTADTEHVTARNWNATIFVLRPIQDVSVPPGERRIQVMFDEDNKSGRLGVLHHEKESGEPVHLQLFGDEVEGGQIIWNLEVAPEASYLRVTVPDSGMQLKAHANLNDGTTWFDVADVREGSHSFDMRLTVLCCPQEGDWPLLLDDCES